jgi:hypothetical protein
MQAFLYTHLVAADDLRAAVSGRGGRGGRVTGPRVLAATPLKIPAGGSFRVRVSLPVQLQTFENLQFELSEPPEGITLRDATVNGSEATFDLYAEAAKVEAGFRSNLIVIVSGERVPTPNAPAQAARRRVPLGVLPAIAFEVVREDGLRVMGDDEPFGDRASRNACHARYRTASEPSSLTFRESPMQDLSVPRQLRD